MGKDQDHSFVQGDESRFQARVRSFSGVVFHGRKGLQEFVDSRILMEDLDPLLYEKITSSPRAKFTKF